MKLPDRTLAPWEANPYRLVSWWEMEKFSAESYYSLASMLAGLHTLYERFDQTKQMIGEFYQSEDKGALKMMLGVVDDCKAIGLAVSTKCASHMVRKLRGGTANIGEWRQLLRQLEDTVRWELEDKLFLYVPPESSRFYDQKEIFSEKVNTKFPEIQFDAIEAGNCYALGRGTACAFHLMRIMERAVQKFGVALGVKLTDTKEWGPILDEINKAIRNLPPKDERTIALSEAAGHLYTVKVAWRNPTMHPKSTYTLEEAADIMSAVKAFTRELAEVI